jgi:hypothetical protein
MPSMNWAEVLLSTLSSAGILVIILTAVGVILRGAIVKYINRRLDAKFDLEMRRHEIGIENLKTFAEHARRIITVFPTLISNVHRAARAIADAQKLTDAHASDLHVAVTELEARLTEYFIVLPLQTYNAVHLCKVAGTNVLSTLHRDRGDQLRQAIDSLEFKRQEALTELRRWAESMGTLFPQLT